MEDDLDAGGGFLDALALDTLALLELRWREVARPLAKRFPDSELADVARHVTTSLATTPARSVSRISRPLYW